MRSEFAAHSRGRANDKLSCMHEWSDGVSSFATVPSLAMDLQQPVSRWLRQSFQQRKFQHAYLLTLLSEAAVPLIM